MMVSKPQRLILELSANCNLSCIMCGFGGQKTLSSRFMQNDLLDSILTQPILNNITEVRLNGRGESTIHPQFAQIVEKIKDAYPVAVLTLFTNAMFSDDSLVHQINSLEINLYVSVDSSERLTYEHIRKGASYDILLSRLEAFEGGTLVFTLQDENWSDIESISVFAAEHDFNLLVNVVRTDDHEYYLKFNKTLQNHWEYIVSQLRLCRTILGESVLIPDSIWGFDLPNDIPTCVTCGTLDSCPNVNEEIMIGYDGHVFPCNMFNPTSFGTLYNESIKSIWNSTPRKRFLSEYKNHYYCQNCSYMVKVR